MGDSDSVKTDNFTTNCLDLDIGLVGNLVDEVTDGQFCTLRENVQDMFAFDKTAASNGWHDVSFAVCRLERFVFVFLSRRLEQEDTAFSHQVLQEFLFLFLEKIASVISESAHLVDFFVIVVGREISFGSVDDHDDTFFDVFEGFERLEEVLGEFGEFVGSGFTDVTFVDHQNDFDFRVDVEESLHEEGVGNFILLAFVIFEPWTVIEG